MPATPAYYRLAIAAAKPFYKLKLRLKKTANADEVAQRFGKTYPLITTQKPMIWCHAVSLGETNTIAPVLQGLLAAGFGLWITNTTATGYRRVAELFAKELTAGEVYHSFVPVDDNAVMARFLAHVQPVAALFIETELWANTLALLEKRQIASILVNARLSDKSFRGYRRFASLSRGMMDNLSLIIAQDADSAKRFRQLGATSDKIRLASSLKWSSKTNPLMIQRAKGLSQAWRLGSRQVIVAASTHEGEEAMLLKALAKLAASFDPRPLLIIVPRHPERFGEVAKLISEHGYALKRRSQDDSPSAGDSVYLADSMGELGVWYALANIAVVGGSLVDIGGHNPIEAAIVGKPIIMGQYSQSCQTIVDKLKSVGALCQVEDSDKLTEALAAWLTHPQAAQHAGQAGQQLAEQYQDATQQQLAMILACIEENAEQRMATQLRLLDRQPLGVGEQAELAATQQSQPHQQTQSRKLIDDLDT